MHKKHMQTIIRRNGHLQMDGTETTEELRRALLYLRQHTYMQCRQPAVGIAIEALLPDISVLTVKSTRYIRAESVDIKHERL